MNLFGLYKKRTDVPKFNKTLVDGLAVSELRDGVGYLSNLIHQIEDTFPEGLGFECCVLADPIREIERSLIRGPTNTLKMEPSTTVMVELRLTLNGTYAGSTFQRIPYLKRGGGVVLHSKRWNAVPVMVDRGVNVKNDGIFIYLSRARYVYKPKRHDFQRNGRLMVDNILTARLHQQNDAARRSNITNGSDRISGAEPTLLLYPLMECGYIETCSKYFGCEIKVEQGSYESIRSKYPYPTAIYSSTNNPTRYINKAKVRDLSHWHVVVEQDNELTQKLAVNLIYLLDIFGAEIETVEDLADVELWKLLTGKFIFNTDDTVSKLIEKVDKHLDQSISRLIDETTRTELLLDGVDVSVPNELFAWLIMNTDRIIRSKEVNSVAGKRLTATRYAFSYLQTSATNFSYACKHIPPGSLNPKRLGQLLRTHFPESSLRRSIVSDSSWQNEKHAADNHWVTTRNIVQQGEVRSSSKNNVMQMYLPENKIHGSRLSVVQVAGLPKSNPGGLAYIGPYITLGPGGRIIPPPEYEPACAALNNILKSSD